MTEFWPKGLVFDLDGTLADSMPAHVAAWNVALHPYGKTWPENGTVMFGGMPSIKVAAALNELWGIEMDCQQVARLKGEAYPQFIGMVKPIEPVFSLAKLHYGKIPLGIATGSRKKYGMMTIEACGFADMFDAIVTVDDVTFPKPHPECFLTVAKLMGVEPKHCLAYEDGKPGMQAAYNAGMQVVDVATLL